MVSKKYYAAKVKNQEVRASSASGGIMFVLAAEMLKRGGVVYGAAMEKDWTVNHIRIDREEDLHCLQGSKYPQSNLSKVMKLLVNDVKEDREILFCGTPCQADAIRKLREKIGGRIVICDIVCHGVASPKVFQSYISWLEKRYGELEQFSFRNKAKGWTNQRWSIKTKNGKLYDENSHINTFKALYYKHLIHRPSCFQCPYTTVERNSDITSADFWEINAYEPSFMDELGVSSVIVHTEYGNELWMAIQTHIEVLECSKDDILQPQLLKPVVKGNGTEDVHHLIINGTYSNIAKKYGYDSFARRIIEVMKNFLRR